MPTFLSRQPSSFEQAPEGGCQLVLVDVEDRGLQQGERGSYYAIELAFQMNKRMKQGTGAPYLITRSFTQSLHPKSKLVIPVEALLDRTLTARERVPGNFDLDLLIGRNCMGTVYHEERDGMTRAKLKDSFMPLLPGMKLLVPEGYTRKRDRQPQQSEQAMAGPLYGERPAPAAPTASEQLQATQEQLDKIKRSGQVPLPNFDALKKRAEQELDAEDDKLPF